MRRSVSEAMGHDGSSQSQAHVDSSSARHPRDNNESLQVSAIIPTHNRPDSLRRLVASLIDTVEVDEVVVVDDASDPPVPTQPGVVLVRNPTNMLLSESRNIGAAAARGEILLFIDDDCTVTPGSIRTLTKSLGEDFQLGMVGPVIGHLSDPSRIWCAGVSRGKWTGRTSLRGARLRVEEALSLPRESEEFPSVFAVRRECFASVEGFDSRSFPMHMGEADFGERVSSRGYRIELVPEAVVLHDVQVEESLARRLHITSPSRAFLVAKDRGVFIRRQRDNNLLLTTRIIFWVLVLAPTYILAILFEHRMSRKERLATIAGFARGLSSGLKDRQAQPG